MDNRHIVWFSCGAASAVTAKLVLEANPEAIIARIIVDNEHEDNHRFAKDCEQWFGKPVVELRSKKYKDCWEVWEKRRYLNGPKGALCTTEMKKKVRQEFEDLTDTQYFGYTKDEGARAERFMQTNPEITCRFPLLERGIDKHECYQRIIGAGLELPAMYRLGYNNANCVGCVKGGAGYWNKIRVDFPHVFERMSKIEEMLDASCIKGRPLRTLPIDAGRHEELNLPDCGLFCGENGGVHG